MGERGERHRNRTLGAWLAGLRPGDPCPWCAGSLEVAEKEGRAANEGSDGMVSRMSENRLTCHGCGCELERVVDTEAPGCERLDHAA